MSKVAWVLTYYKGYYYKGYKIYVHKNTESIALLCNINPCAAKTLYIRLQENI